MLGAMGPERADMRSGAGWVWTRRLALLGLACLGCECLPRTGGDWERDPAVPRSSRESGYNATIDELPTSIDPRTPEAEGTPGRSLQEDLAEVRRRRPATGQGGSGAGGQAPARPGHTPR